MCSTVSQVTYTVQVNIAGAWTRIKGEGVMVARDVAIRIADDETRAGRRARIMRSGALGAVRWWEVTTHRGGPVLAVAHSELDANVAARFGWLVVVERWRCYACDAVATGRRDLTHTHDGCVEPACERHRDDRPAAPAVATLPDFGADADAAVDAAVASVPATFGLRAFPGQTFRASRASSYVSRGQVVVYTQRRSDDGLWLDFAKGSPAELRAALVPAPESSPAPVAEPESSSAAEPEPREGADQVAAAPFAFRALGRRQAHKTDLVDVARALGAVVASGDRAAVPWLRAIIGVRLPGFASPTGQQTCKGDLVAIARALDLDVDDRFACDALRRCIASRVGGRS